MSETEIKAAVSACFNNGLVVEPSGAAALAAALFGKVRPTAGGSENIVVVLTGGNISPADMAKIC